MAISEFHIRAWQVDDTHAQVMVHSSPVGDIRKPITVPSKLRALDKAREFLQESKWFVGRDHQRLLVDVGRQLAQVILPRPVYALLITNLQAVGHQDILRIRLCLDPGLLDLPWEYLYRPDVTHESSLAGFLLQNPRISLVREAPAGAGRLPILEGQQRMVFAGALWSDGQDPWGVQNEYQQLVAALAPLSEFLGIEFTTASGDHIATALRQPATIFHYSGHTDAAKGSGYLVREVKTDSQGHNQPVSFDSMPSEELANLLQCAEARLAVFSACNSGRWAFVEPLLRAGLPALIGAQGVVSVQGAFTFSRKLYESLAVGLSLDEAVTGARFHVLKLGGFGGQESLEWGAFMVYMPATEGILLRRSEASAKALQETARSDSREAIAAVAQRIGPAPRNPLVVDQRALRNAIVKQFSADELEVLCADIRQDLADDGVELSLDLDTVGGLAQGEEALVLKLITYLDRRGYLSYLVNAVRHDRPEINL